MACNLLGMTPLDVLGIGVSNVATFGSTLQNASVAFFDNDTQTNCYTISKSNNTLSFTKEGGVNVGIGTARPATNATLQVQGTLLTSNIGTYNPSSNITFNNQNIAGIKDISFSGSIYQGAAPFKTSQWNNYTNSSNIYFAKNVAIGSSSTTDITGSACNLLVVGDAYVTGTLRAGSMNVAVSTTDALFYADIYNKNVATNSKVVQTNDANISNRILYTFTLSPGRYFISGSLVFQNKSSFTLFDSTNWAQLELHRMTPASLVAAGSSAVPYRVTMLNNISEGTESLNIDWLIDLTDQVASEFVVVISGKGHILEFIGSNESGSSTGSTFSAIPVRAIGYDQNISVNQAIQVHPVRKTFISLPNQTAYAIDMYGYFDLEPNQVDVFINGQKKIYIGAGNEYSVSDNGTNENFISSYSVVLAAAPTTGSKVEIVAWPVAKADTFYSSGYLYQSINAQPSRWQNVNDGGVRLADKCVIDGDLFVKGSIWGGCNTNIFQSGSFATSNTLPINSLSNVIGTINVIDGAITASKLNLSTGNVGIGTGNAIKPLHVQGDILVTGNVYQGSLSTPLSQPQFVSLSSNLYTMCNIGIGTSVVTNALQIAGGDIAVMNGGISVSGNVSATSLSGNIITSSQSNITTLAGLTSLGVRGTPLSISGITASSSVPIVFGGCLSDEVSVIQTNANALLINSPYSFRISSAKPPVFTMNTKPSSTVTFDIQTASSPDGTFLSVYAAGSKPFISNTQFKSTTPGSNPFIGSTASLDIAEGVWIKVSFSVAAALTTGTGAKVTFYSS